VLDGVSRAILFEFATLQRDPRWSTFDDEGYLRPRRGWGQQLRALVGDGAEQQFRGVLLSCRDGLGRVSLSAPSTAALRDTPAAQITAHIGRKFAAYGLRPVIVR
jgi:hypothetical protein